MTTPTAIILAAIAFAALLGTAFGAAAITGLYHLGVPDFFIGAGSTVVALGSFVFGAFLIIDYFESGED